MQICIEHTNGSPSTIAPIPDEGMTCYTETNAANIPTNPVAPFVVVSSCDGSSVSSNSNRIDVDYANVTVSRY